MVELWTHRSNYRGLEVRLPNYARRFGSVALRHQLTLEHAAHARLAVRDSAGFETIAASSFGHERQAIAEPAIRRMRGHRIMSGNEFPMLPVNQPRHQAIGNERRERCPKRLQF